jgi:hypothetical protein
MPDCKLVIIDPIGSYIGGHVDAHRDNEVRSVLAPVAALAEEYGVAVLLVAHTRKSPGKYADDIVLGSRGFTGIVRSSWHLISDEQDPARRLLLSGKSNLSKTAPGLAFRIEPDETGRDNTAHIVWEDTLIDMNADDAMAMANEPSGPGPDPTERNEATQWLADALAGGPRPAKELFAQAEKDGISKGTLKRAKKELCVISGKHGMTGGWTWSLPHGGQKPDRTPTTCAPSDKPAPLLENKGLAGSNPLVDSTEGGQEAQVPECRETRPPPNRLDPKQPGPIDLLNAEQRKKYMAIYHSRPPSMSTDERHRRAWRAAIEKKKSEEG